MKEIDLKKIKWDKESYNQYLNYLISLKQDSYKQFQSKIVTTKYEILGISLPIQRKIAKEIAKGDSLSFLDIATSYYYEEVLIQGLVLASLQDKKLFQKYLEKYVLLVDNWAICDSFCNSLYIINLEKEYWFSYFAKYMEEKREFTIRIALVVFLNFFIEESYLPRIFTLLDQCTSNQYYVNMAESWLLCESYIAFPKKTLDYLLKSKINSFTFNKTISKIKDSYRVEKEEKKYLQTLKRKEKI